MELEPQDYGWPVRVKRPGDRRSLSRSATRALDVMELFGQLRQPLRAVEIAKALDLHPSTANQLLKTMLESAHLTFAAATKTYFPSPRLGRFGAWVVQNYGPDEQLRGLVRDVHTTTGEIITLTTPNGGYMQILDVAGVAEGDELAERGLRISTFGSAIGLAYLSTLTDAVVRRLADQERLRPADIDDVLGRLDTIRQHRAADGPSVGGRVWSVALALPRRYPIPLVLGLAGPADRIRPAIAPLADQLRRAIASHVGDGGPEV